ncbi:MAG: response regulator, partial [Rhodospirillaceae bacterium]|nr:response regulator [Rhodospirillaceae bacterium]
MDNRKVLLVDDEVNVLNGLKRQLRKQFDISTATSGQEALQIAGQEDPFAVVVSDMRMPGMNGVEVLERMQEISPDTTRVMLTGNADQQTAIDAVN